MATKIQLYNGALRILGERKLASLTEASEARRLLDDVYDEGAVRACLESGMWNFAIRSVEAAYTPSVAPDFGFSRAFDKPTDWVRTIALCSDDRFRSPLDATQYSDEAGYWFSDHDTLYIRYVSDDSSYGGDLAGWPMSFTKFVQAHLAFEIAPKLTPAATALSNVAQIRAKALHDARNKDALNEGAQVPVTNSWVRSRMGRSMRRYDRA
jgi:hypothetical protein